VSATIYPHLEELRAMFASKYDERAAFQHLEEVVMQLPHAKEQIAERIEQFKEARARWEETNKAELIIKDGAV